LVLIFFNFF